MFVKEHSEGISHLWKKDTLTSFQNSVLYWCSAQNTSATNNENKLCKLPKTPGRRKGWGKGDTSSNYRLLITVILCRWCCNLLTALTVGRGCVSTDFIFSNKVNRFLILFPGNNYTGNQLAVSSATFCCFYKYTKNVAFKHRLTGKLLWQYLVEHQQQVTTTQQWTVLQWLAGLIVNIYFQFLRKPLSHALNSSFSFILCRC